MESHEGHGIVEMQRVTYVGNDSRLVFEQTRRSHEVALRGTTGFANSANGELAPMWYEDGHVIRLTATGFTQPELISIAESLESAP